MRKFTKYPSNILASSGEYWRDFKLTGLREALRRFDANGTLATSGHWRIAKGGYDLYWELCYDNQPVVDCVAGRLQNICLPDSAWNKIAQIIQAEYPDVLI